MTKSSVFISYSRADSEWLDLVNLYLKQLKHQHQFEFWDDTKIKPGDEWKKQIDENIAHSKVAILLVSANFLASEFINNEEVPEILKRAKSKGVKIFTVVLDICNFDEYSPLYKYNCINDPEMPLETMDKAEQQRLLVKLAREVREELHKNDDQNFFGNKLIGLLILSALASNSGTLFSMNDLSRVLEIHEGIQVRRKMLYSILEKLEMEDFILKEKIAPTTKDKSSTFWRISEQGLRTFNEFKISFNSVLNKTN